MIGASWAEEVRDIRGVLLDRSGGCVEGVCVLYHLHQRLRELVLYHHGQRIRPISNDEAQPSISPVEAQSAKAQRGIHDKRIDREDPGICASRSPGFSSTAKNKLHVALYVRKRSGAGERDGREEGRMLRSERTAGPELSLPCVHCRSAIRGGRCCMSTRNARCSHIVGYSARSRGCGSWTTAEAAATKRLRASTNTVSSSVREGPSWPPFGFARSVGWSARDAQNATLLYDTTSSPPPPGTRRCFWSCEVC